VNGGYVLKTIRFLQKQNVTIGHRYNFMVNALLPRDLIKPTQNKAKDVVVRAQKVQATRVGAPRGENEID
jgi:hypothetical protein